MKCIRMLLSGIAPLQNAAVKQAILDQDDMEIVDEVGEGMELLIATARARPDVIVLGFRGSEPPGICSHLLNEYPHIKVLGLAADGYKGFLCDLQLRIVSLGEQPYKQLLAMVRAAVRNEGL